MAASPAEPTGSDLVTAVLKHVRAQEGDEKARNVAKQMLAAVVAILCVEFGSVELSKMLADVEFCANVAVSEKLH